MFCSESGAEGGKQEKAGVHKAQFSRTVLHIYIVLCSLGSFTELWPVTSLEEGIQQAHCIASNSILDTSDSWEWGLCGMKT